MNTYAKKLMEAFSQFRKIHWRPPHIKELKPSEFMILHTVKHSYSENDCGIMISELSDLLKIARPTVTQLVNSLQKKSFVEKRPDEYDKRIVRVCLSEKGKNLARLGEDEFYHRFRGLAEYLGEKKSEELATLLQETFKYFHKIAPRENKQC